MCSDIERPDEQARSRDLTFYLRRGRRRPHSGVDADTGMKTSEPAVADH